MPDATRFVKAVKKTAVDAVEAGKPVNVCFGTVISAAPLSVDVEQKAPLGAAQLVLSRNVTDYETEMTSKANGREMVTVHNSLAAGDKLILLRQQEGQKYVVVDKIG